MSQKRKTSFLRPSHRLQHLTSRSEQAFTAPDNCDCQLLLVPEQIEETAASGQAEVAGNEEERSSTQRVLVAQSLRDRLYARLDTLFPRREPLSILVLHMYQLETISLVPQEPTLYKRQRYHGSAGLLDQVLTYARRAVRTQDELLIHSQSGAVLILPGVDRQGVHTILERVYCSIALLQAETLVPPLTLETVIQLGIATYPEPACSIEQLLSLASLVARHLTLRPALQRKRHGKQPGIDKRDVFESPQHKGMPAQTSVKQQAVPFLALPPELPQRLTHLIPYDLACQLRCAPVGRDQHSLTVAMVEPTNSESVHHLQKITGLFIFTVACDEQALTLLLAKRW